MKHIEEIYGGAMTYAAAAANAGVGIWLEQNWFLILSAIAILIRIGIDIPRLYRAWHVKAKVEKLHNK